ncbi:hypothetical protein IB234_05350 [Pseudomonas sp. PDM16]|uniref:type II secretion system protein GspM n=1 Tax=Pseudomonas sp. PDM16 TaxID=2769292 RepID=UPI00177EB5DD|nr:type II secretion system protein GspM [Pseudomonas sp. PDM16]MBD9413985.1 hypothetical protein [Pseudomonas sp. PDM16]
MNASWLQSHRQGLASLTIAAALFLLFVALVATPLISRWDRYQLELTKDGRVMQHLQAMLASRDDLEQAYADFQQRGLDRWVYQAASAEAIELDIQKRVTDLLSTQGVQVRTVSALRGLQRDDHQIVGMRFLFSGTLPSVLTVFDEIELMRPLLLIEDVRMSPVLQGGRRDAPQKQLLEIEMSVVTFLPLVSEGQEP